MCDYSLHSIKSRPARVSDKLTTRDFGTGTRGFAASEDANVAVCVRPGTEFRWRKVLRRSYLEPTGLTNQKTDPRHTKKRTNQLFHSLKVC